MTKLPYSNRRSFLRGAGGLTLWLPFSFFFHKNRIAYAQAEATYKLITYYFPNGCQPDLWNYQNALSPLLPMRDKITVLGGVKNSVSEAFGRDPHEQGGATLFTGVPLKDGNQSTGASIDQIAAKQLNKDSLLKEPLVTGVWRGFAGGEYRSITWSRRSWREDGQPVEPLQNPLTIFNNLFNAPLVDEEMAKQVNLKRSILDSVVKQYRSMIGEQYPLTQDAKIQLKDHLEKIRELERSMVQIQKELPPQCQQLTPPNSVRKVGGLVPYDQFEAAFHGQIDLLVTALQCGFTNTASLMFCCAGEEYVNRNISSVPDHDSSHYTNEARKQIFISYRQYHMRNLLRLMTKMNAITEANGRTLLDNSVIVVGSEFGESREHIRSPQPHLLVGGAKLQMGREINLGGTYTNNDVYRTALSGVGVDVPRVGLAEHNNGLIPQLLNTNP